MSPRRLEITLRGPVFSATVIEVVRSAYAGFSGRRILWDLTEAELQLGADDYVRIAATAREFVPPGIERKTAYIVADNATGLSLWQYANETVLAGIRVEYRVFFSRAEAIAWLDQP